MAAAYATLTDESFSLADRPVEPNLQTIPPVEQQLHWLDRLLGKPEEYAQVWLAQLATVGSSAHFMIDPSGQPRLFVSYPNDSQWNDRRLRIDALCEHMIAFDLRSHIVAQLS